jgi:hypothetical protein
MMGSRLLNTAMALTVLFAPFQSAIGEPEAMELSGDLEADFSFIDEIRNPTAAPVLVPIYESWSNSAVATARTLGLTRFRAAMAWRIVNRSELTAVFRPDALAWPSEIPNKVLTPDHDSRAGLKSAIGRPYRSSPMIKFMDAYELNYLATDQLKIGIGVRESSYSEQMSYESGLAFGLAVQLPRSFNSASIQWSGFDNTEGFRPGVARSGYRAGIAVTSGRGDRGEALDFSRASEDYAPTSADPYLGVLVDLAWTKAKQLSLGMVSGYRSQRDTLGRATDFYAQLYSHSWFLVGALPLAAAIDVRYSKESWMSERWRVAGLVQQSLSLTSSCEFTPGHHAGLGYFWGTSQRHRDLLAPHLVDKVSGWQVDMQYRRQFDPGLSLVITAAHEARGVDRDGEVIGGFGANADDDRDYVRRFAVEVLYRTGLTR